MELLSEVYWDRCNAPGFLLSPRCCPGELVSILLQVLSAVMGGDAMGIPRLLHVTGA